MRLWIAPLAVATLIAACSPRGVGVCAPGASAPCSCDAGVSGLQTCADDGKSFDACVCNTGQGLRCGADGGDYLSPAGDCVGCWKDDQCTGGQTCDLLTGVCGVHPVTTVDGGPVPVCEVGAFQCSADAGALEVCQRGDGGNSWSVSAVCPQGCNSSVMACTVCVPGSTSCQGKDGTPAFFTCDKSGAYWHQESCGDAGQTCTTLVPADAGVQGIVACRACVPNTTNCETVPDGGKGLVSCDDTGSVLTFTSCWPTNQCIDDGGAGMPECIPPVCVPGYIMADGGAALPEAECVYPDGGIAPDGTTQGRQVCASDGLRWTTTDPATGQSTNCGPGLCGQLPDSGSEVCISACSLVNPYSGSGCDFWAATLSNSTLATAFTGGDGGPSDFDVVVEDAFTIAANVTVTDASGTTTYAAVAVQPGESASLSLPWNEICGTGSAPNRAFHIQSDVPIVAYQWNPLHQNLPENKVCTTSSDCDDPAQDVCVNGQCFTPASGQEASTLLSTSQLGTSYVPVAQAQQSLFDGTNNAIHPGFMAIVATQDDTVVQVTFSAAVMSTTECQGTASLGLCPGPPHVTSGSLASQPAGANQTYNLNAGDVLQFWSSNAGKAPTCVPFGSEQACLWANDLTGSVVTSVPNAHGVAEPVAVFGGADCSNEPYNYGPCNHTEDQMVPFNVWGSDYVAVAPPAYPGSSSESPGTWRVASGCGLNSCPSGATITITPPIAAESVGGVPAAPDVCRTTGSVTTCVLPALGSSGVAPWFEFLHAESFSLHSDNPVEVASVGNSETAEGSSAAAGGSSLVMLPATNGWHSHYSFVAPGSFAPAYASVSVVDATTGRSCASCNIELDGVLIPSASWVPIAGTNVWTANVELSGQLVSGLHTMASTPSAPFGVVIRAYAPGASAAYTPGPDLGVRTFEFWE